MVCALLGTALALVGPSLAPGRALLPADLLVQFEPWRSQVDHAPNAHWDALVWDGIAQYYPWRLFAARALRDGHLPLWNPHQFCGTPFLANGQSAVLYPPNLLFWLLSVARAFGWSALLHLVLAGWFAYLFLRTIHLGRFGAITGAVVWQASSFLVAWLHLPTVLCTVTWLPLALLLCELALTSGRARYAVAAGAALGISYLAGHPQMFVFEVLITVAYLLARGIGRAAPLSIGRRFLRMVRVSAVVGLIAAGISAAQLLPTLDLLRVAHRTFVVGPDSYAKFIAQAFPAPQLAGLLLPHAFGHPALGTYVGKENYAAHCLYIGVAALALAAYAALFSRSWQSRFFAAVVVLSLLAALGTPVNLLLYHWLPGYARGGGPARIIVLAVFSLAMLAGIGADEMRRRAEQRRRAAMIAPVALLALTVSLGWGWKMVGARTLSEFSPGSVYLLQGEALRCTVLAGGAAVLVLMLVSVRLRPLAQLGIICVLAADLLLGAQHHVHVSPLSWVYSDRAAPVVAEGRLLGNARDWPLGRFPRAVFPPNAAMVYERMDVFGYDSLYLARYRDFASLIQGGDPSPRANGNLLLARLGPAYGLDMLSLAGASTVLSPSPVRGLKLVRAGTYGTYHNPYRAPRAWIADSAISLPSHGEVFEALVKLGPQPDCIIVTGAAGPPQGPVAARPRAPVVEEVSPNEVVVNLSGAGGGYLFLADSCAPGWRAYADGKELDVLIANLTFRAVAPPAEAGSVIFRYEPSSFLVGLFATLVAGAFACGACGWVIAARR